MIVLPVTSFSETTGHFTATLTPVLSLGRDWDDIPLLYPGVYHNYSEVLDEINHFNDSVPLLIDLELIGHSVENRNIYCVRVTNENITRPKAGVFYVAHHHAREQITVEAALRFIQRLINNYGIDNEITGYIDLLEIFIIPTLNPDGLPVVVDQGYEWLRKNLRAFDDDGDGLFDEDRPDDMNNDGHVANYDVFEKDGNDWSYLYSYKEGINDDGDLLINEDDVGGVDLNRNYDYRFNDSSVDSGWGSEKTGETYPGTAPFSEPETAALRDFVLKHKFSAAISLHSGVNATYFPWASEKDKWAEYEIYYRIKDTLMDILPSYFTRKSAGSNTARSISSNVVGTSYTSAGDWSDWMYAVAGCTVPMTYEIYHNASADNGDTYKLVNETSNRRTWEWTGMFAYFDPEEQYIDSLWDDIRPVMDYWLEITPRLVINVVSLVSGEGLEKGDLMTVDLYINNQSPELSTIEEIFILKQDGNPVFNGNSAVKLSEVPASTEKVVHFTFELPDSLGSSNLILMVGNNYTGFFPINIVEVDNWSSYTNFKNSAGFLTSSLLLLLPAVLMRTCYQRNHFSRKPRD
ncbi:MAG: M14 family zinc carboxypeptidase [Candidatus Hodarchaeales archaeon]